MIKIRKGKTYKIPYAEACKIIAENLDLRRGQKSEWLVNNNINITLSAFSTILNFKEGEGMKEYPGIIPQILEIIGYNVEDKYTTTFFEISKN